MRHSATPMSYAATAPAVWRDEFEHDPDSVLGPDQCVVMAELFFVKGLVEIPVVGTDEVFSWVVWVSLSRDNFARAVHRWEDPGRESEPPYFGWLSTELTVYPHSTLDLKTLVHTRPVGERPFVELEPTDHPLAVEQRTGITVERVRRIAELVMHP
ncbi:DUF2199 domain-containing protein [Stackebrandtia albiflava]